MGIIMRWINCQRKRQVILEVRFLFPVVNEPPTSVLFIVLLNYKGEWACFHWEEGKAEWNLVKIPSTGESSSFLDILSGSSFTRIPPVEEFKNL